MGISKNGCSHSITKEDLEHKYRSGFADGAIVVCSLIIEELKEQRFEILDNKVENYEIALQTVNDSIQAVEERLNKYSHQWKNKGSKYLDEEEKKEK